MKKKRFLSAICKDDFIKDGVTDFDALVEKLVNIGFLVKKDIKYKNDIKKLNSLWNGDGDAREYQLFSSMIRNNQCFFVSDEYIREVISMIFAEAKNEANAHFLIYKKRNFRKEKGYINKNQLLEFYTNELIRINGESIMLEDEYKFLDIDLNTMFFPERINEILKGKLNSDGKFNRQYITYYKLDTCKPHFSLKYPFTNLIQLFCINEKLKFLKERISDIHEDVENDKKNNLKIKFKKEYLRLFNSEQAFNIFIEFVEIHGKDNINASVAVKLKELLEDTYPQFNLSRLSKKLSKKEFSEFLKSMFPYIDIGNLRSVDASKNENIKKTFFQAIKNCISKH